VGRCGRVGGDRRDGDHHVRATPHLSPARADAMPAPHVLKPPQPSHR
jgi:hypothetical protein